MKRLFLLFVCSSVLLASLPALDVEAFLGYTDQRSQSMGGYHAALADDFSVLFTNPAGLAAVKPAFSAARINIAASGPVFDLANLIIEGSSGDISTELLSFLSANSFSLYTGAEIDGPVSIGYVGEGLGFGVFQRTRVLADISGISSVSLTVAEDFLIDGGYAFRIPTGDRSSLDVGLVAKGYVRASSGLSGDVLSLTGLLSDFSTILNQNLDLTTGIGLDAGIRWNWREVVALGLACTDAFSPAKVVTYSSLTNFFDNPTSAFVRSVDGLIAPKLNFGAMWKPPLGRLGTVFDSVTFAADYLDILDLFAVLPRNAILNVSLGCEVRVLDILTFRAGIKDALLEAGAAFDLGFMKVGVSAWGQELGSEPGQRSLYNMEVSLDFVY